MTDLRSAIQKRAAMAARPAVPKEPTVANALALLDEASRMLNRLKLYSHAEDVNRCYRNLEEDPTD